MKACPTVRSLRAAVFAALCVLLAAGAHALAVGAAPSIGAQLAGFVPVFTAGWLLGGGERSLARIEGGTLTAQGGLHVLFGAVRSQVTQVATVGHGMRAVPSQAHVAGLHTVTGHATAVHVVASVLLAWWLRRGEAALWALLRWAMACVPGLAAWWQVWSGVRGAPGLPRFVRGAVGDTGALRQALLRHAVHRRGPPVSVPYTR